MTVVRDILTRSVRLLGAVAQGTPLPAGEAEDALSSLNTMLDGWNTQALTIYTKNFDTYTLVPGKQSYTVGPTGDIAVAAQLRPTNIDRAQLRIATSTPELELPIELIEDAAWAAIRVKNFRSPIPTRLYNSDNFPNTTLYLWPIPDVAHQLILWTWNQLSNIANLNTDVTLPKGYERAIIYNLAVELSPEYNLVPSPLVIQIATDSLANIKRMNSKPAYLSCDAGLLGAANSRFNWMTGE